jgi:arginyl-tRNA synthetase
MSKSNNMNISQLKEFLNNFQPSSTNQSIVWTIPTDLEHGILTTNIAFVLAKELRQNPNQIALTISDELNIWLSNPFPKGSKSLILGDYQINTISSTPIGAYINIIPTEEFFTELLSQNLDKENLITKSQSKFVLDYIGANVAKRLHAGHMRNCNIGEAIRRILLLKYPNMITDNHWGDWGVNMGILIWGWKNYDHNSFEINIELITKLTIIYVWANNQKDVVENWESLVRAEFIKLEQKDDENIKLWNEFILATKNDLKQDLELLNVRPHDIEQGESFYEGDMNLLNELMEKSNLWKIDAKARYFDFDNKEKKVLDPRVLIEDDSKLGRSYMISSTGYTSYCYRDVATKLQYARDHKADISLVITDKTQSHNFDQAFGIIDFLAGQKEFQDKFGVEVASRLKKENMKHLGYGFLKLETGKMSSRTGNVLLLRDLFNQVQAEATKSILSKNQTESNPFPKGSEQSSGGFSDNKKLKDTSQKLTVAALKWNDLKQSYEQDITFDINQVLNFTGNTGVYQLYTYARLNSVLKKLKNVVHPSRHLEQSERSPVTEDIIINKTNLNPLEQSILKQIWILPEILESICNNYQIHLLTNHLYELSNLVNKWYNDVPILTDPRREFMVTFITKVMEHLEFSLNLLGIEVVEEI